MKKSIGIIAGIVVLAVAGVVVFMLVKGIHPGDVAELVAEEGARQLREPMRPERDGTRVLIFALDGVGADEMLAAIRSGAAPHIAALLGAEIGDGVFASAYAAPDVLSVLPSTTLAAWASIFTGEPPARTGIPGNEFFVREQRRFYAPAPVTIEDATHVMESYTDDLMGSVLAVPTLYERADVRSYVALSHIHRGADMLILPDVSSMAEIALALAAGLVEDDEDDVDREEYAELDEESAELALETMRERGVPDLQAIYFPGVDLFTHVAKNPLEDQREYVTAVLDPAVGAVLNAYRRAGVLEQTYVMFIADHGHTPVIEDDRHALEAEGDDEPPALLERVGFRMRPLSLDIADDHDFQATIAYQGAFAYVYLADRSTCTAPGDPCDWARPPRLEEDVLTVVRAFDEANRTGAHVPALRGTLDLILAREPRAGAALPFEVWDGTRLVPVEEYLAQHPRPDLLDLAARLRGLGEGPYGNRAGDVLLLARSGAGWPIEERYYFSGLYRSWHGSPHGQDSRVPLIVARPGTAGADLREQIRAVTGDAPTQLHVVPLVEAFLRTRHQISVTSRASMNPPGAH